jgi:hypothetical protein
MEWKKNMKKEKIKEIIKEHEKNRGREYVSNQEI